MVRFVKVIAILFILGFMLWALLPSYNSLVSMANNSTITLFNMTSLELATWRLLLPVLIPAVIVIAVIWHHFSRKSAGGGEE